MTFRCFTMLIHMNRLPEHISSSSYIICSYIVTWDVFMFILSACALNSTWSHIEFYKWHREETPHTIRTTGPSTVWLYVTCCTWGCQVSKFCWVLFWGPWLLQIRIRSTWGCSRSTPALDTDKRFCYSWGSNFYHCCCHLQRTIHKKKRLSWD